MIPDAWTNGLAAAYVYAIEVDAHLVSNGWTDEQRAEFETYLSQIKAKQSFIKDSFESNE